MEFIKKQLQEELEQLQWELASGAYAGCSQESLDNLYSRAALLEEEIEKAPCKHPADSCHLCFVNKPWEDKKGHMRIVCYRCKSVLS